MVRKAKCRPSRSSIDEQHRFLMDGILPFVHAGLRHILAGHAGLRHILAGSELTDSDRRYIPSDSDRHDSEWAEVGRSRPRPKVSAQPGTAVRERHTVPPGQAIRDPGPSAITVTTAAGIWILAKLQYHSSEL